MSALGRRLMRLGRPEGELSRDMREVLGRVRADLRRFAAGMTERVTVDGEQIVVELDGRSARCVAQQVAKRVRGPMTAVVEDRDGGATVRITEGNRA